MSLYEILKAAKIGTAPDVYTKLRAQIAPFAKGGGSTPTEKELEGVPPLSFTSDGSPLIACTVYGDMSRTGTPSPTTPIQPQECGDLETEGTKAGQYKIPISSANTTTPVYLGEVHTTRKIKKLVLTGEESWNTYQSTYYITVNDYYRMYDIGSHISVCSHYPIVQLITLPEMHYGLGGLIDGNTHSAWNGNIVFNPSPMILSITDWKSYLTAQYANGTPVCVWYVLATEETGIVNEPIRKIGDYADSISVSNIPTVDGSNTIDIDTTLSPSKLYIKYYE